MDILRSFFPFFNDPKNKLIYLDTAASAQKPQQVVDAMQHFYLHDYANIHRGIYQLTERATENYEATRKKVAQFIGAQSNEVVFTRGTTEGVNFIATSWGSKEIKKGDAIVITALEHHANLLPWQVLCKKNGAELRVIRLLSDGNLDMEHAQQLIDNTVKLVAVTHSSNAIGTYVDVKTLANYAHAVGARILVDAAQSVVHERIDVVGLDCDFLVFSGHKLYGPTGIGVLFIKDDLHDEVEPYQYGGGMVFNAGYHNASWLPAPRKFEAGTPPIAEVIGLGVAIEFLAQLDRKEIQSNETALCRQLINGLAEMPNIKVLGPKNQLKERGHLVSFIVEGIHAHDVAAYLDQHGICVRAGHQCAQPLAQQLGLDAAVRVSFGMYNTAQEVTQLLTLLQQL